MVNLHANSTTTSKTVNVFSDNPHLQPLPLFSMFNFAKQDVAFWEKFHPT